MFSRFNQLRKWHFCSLLFLSILLSSASSNVHSLNAVSPQSQNSTAPRLTLNITDWWNSPVAISKVRLKDQEISPGSSIVATDDWPKYLSIEGINKSEKTISYIAYAIDFTIADEKSLYRLRLQDGTFYLASPDALTAPGGLRILKGQNHNISFTNDSRRCPSTLIGEINERKWKITKVELFVETVGYTDDTLWAFGSRLKHNKKTSVFENIEYGNAAGKNSGPSTNFGKGFLPKGTPAKSYGCCIPNFTYTQGGGNPTPVRQECSDCPPSSGGGTCPAPRPLGVINSLNGQGSSGIALAGFTSC